MERRQIILLVAVGMLIILLNFLNYVQKPETKTTNQQTKKISKDKGQVKGISERLDSGLRFAEEKAGQAIQNTTTYIIEQASSSA